MVTRRRSFSNQQPTPTQPKPFQPFFTQPSYADVLRKNPILATKPSSPRTQTKPAVFISPHGPSNLRFPPSPTYPEWKGRCFNCCRMGHNVVRCRNPKRYGKCWRVGHIGATCRQPAKPEARTTVPATTIVTKKRCEPLFADLLVEPAKPLPANRSLKMVCFVERDEEYFAGLGWRGQWLCIIRGWRWIWSWRR